MDRKTGGAKPLASALLALVALAGVGCSEINSEPNVEQGGVLDSPNHQAETTRQMEERQDQNRASRGGGMGGGGGSY